MCIAILLNVFSAQRARSEKRDTEEWTLTMYFRFGVYQLQQTFYCIVMHRKPLSHRVYDMIERLNMTAGITRRQWARRGSLLTHLANARDRAVICARDCLWNTSSFFLCPPLCVLCESSVASVLKNLSLNLTMPIIENGYKLFNCTPTTVSIGSGKWGLSPNEMNAVSG